jgi:hypothetical protein
MRSTGAMMVRKRAIETPDPTQKRYEKGSF